MSVGFRPRELLCRHLGWRECLQTPRPRGPVSCNGLNSLMLGAMLTLEHVSVLATKGRYLLRSLLTDLSFFCPCVGVVCEIFACVPDGPLLCKSKEITSDCICHRHHSPMSRVYIMEKPNGWANCLEPDAEGGSSASFSIFLNISLCIFHREIYTRAVQITKNYNLC